MPKLVPINAAYAHAELSIVKVKARESFCPIASGRTGRKVSSPGQVHQRSLCVDGDTPHHPSPDAILYAYNNHCGLRLSPDDLLQCYRAAVCRCANDHARSTAACSSTTLDGSS